MEEAVVEVINELGVHARPAAIFVQTASKFKAEVEVEKDGRRVNGKSIMGIMTLAARKGSQLKITVSGEEAPEALNALKALVEQGFGDYH